MKSRILSLLLVFVMLLGLMPTTALAVTNGSGTQQSPLSVTTYEELKAALADNTTQYIVVNEFETNYDDGIVIVNYEDTSDVIGNLLVGCRLYDADDKHELDEYYTLNYVHNATVLKYNLDITFDANGGKGLMKKITFNTLSNDYFTLPESEFYAPQGKRFKCWSIDGIEKAVGETFEPTKDTVISAVWVDIPANELGGKGTKESPLYVNTYAELKAALADDVTEYIIVKDFLYTNDGGYHLINNPIDGEDYALWSNPDIHKHLTIDTKVRLGVYLACPNITKGIEVAGKLTIDGSGSFNTSFLSNKRGTVINVTSTGTLIVEDPVTIDATSIWHTEQHNIEAEAIHSKGHLTINGGTFKGHFDRVSSTSVTLNAVYVEAGKAEFYGGDFRTVNTRTSVDKGCEGGLLVVSNPSANNGKDINELIKLDGGTYQRFAVFSLGNKQWKASDLMFGSYFLDAETGNEIAANFYDTTYIPNLRVVKHTYHVWFDSNGGEGSMSMVTLNNKNYKLPPCDITAPTGMKFKGWAVNSADSDDIYHTDENFVLKGDTVLYAAWEKNVINEVKINTTEPTAGNYIGDQEISILTDDSSLSIYAHEWYESEEILTTFETFESGKTYRLKVRIATTKSFTNDAKVYVNGEEATVSSCDGSSILFYYDFTLPSYGYTITFGADGGTGEMAAIPDASGEYTLPVCRFAAPRGKQFKVWKVNGVEKAVGDKIVITADTTIIAVWEGLPTAMVSYHENGGSGTMVGDVVTIGDKFTLENCTYIAPEGYQFKAWAIGSVNGEQKQPGEQITITGETYIYAIWEAVEYDVTIIGGTASVGAGTPITKATMGTTVTLTAGAAPSGQMFDKWVVNGVTVADENSATTTFVMPNGAVTATATYKDIPAPTEYMVSYYPGEAEGTPDSDMIVEGTQFTLAACMFQAPEGKMFKAWAIGSLNGEQKQPGEQITITGETYIYAIWEAVEYDVTVTGGTASVGAGTPITKATMGTTVTLTAGAAPSGQMFDKWVVNGVVVDDANSATTTFTMPANNVTAQATYKDIPVVTYTVSFDANGGSGTMTPATGVSGDYVLPVCGFTAPNGKQFKAWSVGGVEKDAGATINVTANTTVTAIWENIPVVTYTVSFAANGGTGTMADATGISGEYTLPANGFTAPDGMQFKAWMVGGSEKAVGDKITVTANTTVTAIWENIPVTYYTVTFDSAGGSAVTAQTIEAGQKATKPADPTKAGYDFKGWTLNGSTYDFNSAVNGDITLVATWEQQQVVPTVYTVTFDSNGGSAVTAQNIEAGQKATKPADPTKAGYDFKGWTLNGSAYDFNTAVNGDITLVATWEQQQVVPTTYTVSFVANGGTGTMADVTGITGEYTLPANGFTAPDGKQFKAWSVGGVEKAVGDKITVTADTTVTAVWENIPITTYTVTFNANGGSVTPANATTEADGKLATLPTPTRSGSYTFKGWYTASSGGTQVTVDKVYTEDTTIYAQWNYTGSTGGGGGVSKYTVKFETNAGTTVANKSVTRNAKLDEPTAPTKEGFKFDGWYTDKELTTAYDFDTKVTKSFTLYAKWTEIEKEPEDTDVHNCPSKAFTDLDVNAWYHLDTDYAIENGIFKGVTETTFAPNGKLTRAMLVTVLYRVEGEPATNRSIPFADVDMGAYYANAVIWAKQNGIVNGVSETEFAPDNNITREQIAAIMHRYAQYKGYDVSVGENTNILSYDDFDSISEYAIASMQWACGSGLMNGKTATTLNPLDNATRAEIAAILHRFIEANK